MRTVDYIITIDGCQFVGEIEFHDSESIDEVMAAIAEDMRRETMSQGKDHREQQGGWTASCERCTDPDGVPCFPQYGPAPHVHVPHETGAFMVKQDIPREQWEGFTEDPEWSGFGVHWCPYCGDGKPGQQGGEV